MGIFVIKEGMGIRVPLVMDCDDPMGITHVNSYWRVTGIDFKAKDRSCLVQMTCWHTQQTHDQGFSPCLQHSYMITNSEFNDLLVHQVTGNLGGALVDAIEDYVIAAPDGYFAMAVKA